VSKEVVDDFGDLTQRIPESMRAAGKGVLPGFTRKGKLIPGWIGW
jgi:hypothetical protein